MKKIERFVDRFLFLLLLFVIPVGITSIISTLSTVDCFVFIVVILGFSYILGVITDIKEGGKSE